MLWITWRQHRTALLSTLAATVLISALMLWLWQGVAELNDACAQHDCITGVAGALGARVSYVYTALNLLQPVLGGLIAVFWGAPLLAREYEQHTNLLVWSQDVTPLRWIGSKVVLLGSAAVLLSAGLAAASWQLVEAMGVAGNTFGMDGFRALDLWPPVQVLYTLFGFVLGLATGLVVRRTVLALGATLVVFALVRAVIANTLLQWLEPTRMLTAPTDDWPLPSGSYSVGTVYLDAAGQEMAPIRGCYDTKCMVEHGAHTLSLTYQPVERLATFQWMEVIAYALLTLVAAGVAWTLVRRATRVS